MQKLAAELNLDPDQLLRGRRAASLQQPGDDRRRRARSLGVYRKSHIPDGPGYEEKFYFRPGNTGFKVWQTPARATLGVGICWDQWYPETARAMMLMGAEILFYPTAIGTEPHDPDLDTTRLWRRAMIGHAVSNVVPVVAANRIGDERGQRFYGHSFICDERGDILAEFGAKETGVIVATLDLAAARSTAPPSASSATAGPSFTAGSSRTSERDRARRRLEHRRVEPAGVLVVARAMIAIDQDAAVGQRCSRRDGRIGDIAASRAPDAGRLYGRSGRARRPRDRRQRRERAS